MGTVALKWLGSKMMTGVDSRGNPLVIGSWPEKEPPWSGLKPSDLLLLAAASCSTHDVLNILRKQRQDLQSLEITCEGDQATEAPYAFRRIHLHFAARGKVEAEKLERAIELAIHKYCSVISSLHPEIEISSDYRIQD